MFDRKAYDRARYEAAKAAGLPWGGNRDKAHKAEYDRARRASHVDERPTTCRGCGKGIVQPRTSVRLYCDDNCRYRTWYATNYVHHDRVWPDPMPMPYVGHPVFEQAMKAAGLDKVVAYASDWGQYDLIGVATLAILEGEDPRQAVRAFRAQEKAHNARASRYVIDVGADGDGTIIVQKEYDAA